MRTGYSRLAVINNHKEAYDLTDPSELLKYLNEDVELFSNVNLPPLTSKLGAYYTYSHHYVGPLDAYEGNYVIGIKMNTGIKALNTNTMSPILVDSYDGKIILEHNMIDFKMNVLKPLHISK